MLKNISLLLIYCVGLTAQTTYNVVFVDSVTDPQCTGGVVTGLPDQATAKALVEACVKIERQDPPVSPPPIEIPLDNLFAGMLRHLATLTWTNSISPNVIEYDVERSEISADGPFMLVATVPRADQTIHQDPLNDSLSGQTVWYRAKARDDQGLESEYSNVADATVPIAN